jgi:hypothetical protein
MTPSRATPITLAIRDDLSWLLQSARVIALRRNPGPAVLPTWSMPCETTARSFTPTW